MCQVERESLKEVASFGMYFFSPGLIIFPQDKKMFWLRVSSCVLQIPLVKSQ